VATSSESAAGRAKKAFGSLLSGLSATGVFGPITEGLDGIEGAMESITEKGHSVGTTLAGIGAAGVGIGVTLSGLGSTDKAAQQQLQASIEATGHSYSDFSDQIDSTISKMAKFGHSAGGSPKPAAGRRPSMSPGWRPRSRFILATSPSASGSASAHGAHAGVKLRVGITGRLVIAGRKTERFDSFRRLEELYRAIVSQPPAWLPGHSG